jgi:enterochelin esterase family protein
VEDGRANFILDNLIAAGRSLPMIVVMPRGHVVADRQIDREKNNEMLENALVKEIVPYVDANYRVRAGRENRAIAGLSMGGGQTLRFGLHHPELFASVIGFSSAIRYPDSTLQTMFAGLIADAAKTNREFKLIQLHCGTKDHLLDASDAFDKFLTAHQIRHEYKRTDYESMWPGRRDDHTWPIWRMNLRDVAPVLFR